MSAPRFDLQGHRGARGLFPENTLEGFAAAMALGVRAFELDVAVTRDGVAVLSHDPALNADLTRGPDGAWLDGPGPLIRDLTLRELGAYDVGRLRPGSPTARRFPQQRPHDGARVPTLDALLALDSGLRLTIELKVVSDHPEWTVSPEEMAERVLHRVDAHGAADRVMLESFDWRAPRHLRRIRPGLALALLTSAETEAAPALWWGREGTAPAAVAEEGVGTWAAEHVSLTEARIAAAHALGLAVLPWTVNEAADMRRLAGWGVAGLITDYPDRWSGPAGA